MQKLFNYCKFTKSYLIIVHLRFFSKFFDVFHKWKSERKWSVYLVEILDQICPARSIGKPVGCFEGKKYDWN